MPFVEGYLDERIMVGPGRPSHPIVPGGPVDPGYGVEGPVDPGYGVPLPPVTVWPSPPGGEHPSHPIPPTYPVDPGYGVPITPGVWPSPPSPPPGVWPPPVPVKPSHPIYPTSPGHPSTGPVPPQPPAGGAPGTPAHPIALPPGSVWPPLPPEIGGPILAICWLVGIGYRWVVLDPSLAPDNTLPPAAGTPSHPIAPGGPVPTPQR